MAATATITASGGGDTADQLEGGRAGTRSCNAESAVTSSSTRPRVSPRTCRRDGLAQDQPVEAAVGQPPEGVENPDAERAGRGRVEPDRPTVHPREPDVEPMHRFVVPVDVADVRPAGGGDHEIRRPVGLDDRPGDGAEQLGAHAGPPPSPPCSSPARRRTGGEHEALPGDVVGRLDAARRFAELVQHGEADGSEAVRQPVQHRP